MAPEGRKTPNFDEELFSVLMGLGMPRRNPDVPPTSSEVVSPPPPVATARDVDVLLSEEVARQQARAPHAPSTVTARNIFHHPDAHPLVLDLLLLRRYGAEFLTWETETLEHVIPRDFGVSSLSRVNLEKVQAMRTLHLVDTPWTSWEVFGWCAQGLIGIPADFLVIQTPTASMAAVAVDIFARVRTDAAWSEEVLGYLSVVCAHDGVFVPPAPLGFVHVDAPEGIDVAAIEHA